MNTRRFSTFLAMLFSLVFLAGCEPATPTDQPSNTQGVDNENGNNEQSKATVEVTDQSEDKDDQTEEKTSEVPKAKPGKFAVKNESSEITFNTPKPIASKDVLKNYISEMAEAAPEYYKEYGAATKEEFVTDSVHFYDVGEIKAEPYVGQKLLTMLIECDGPCFTVSLARFAWDEETGDLTYLDNLSYEDYLPDYMDPLTRDGNRDFSIAALQAPKTLMLPDESNSVSLGVQDADFHPELDLSGDADDVGGFIDLGKVAFTDPKWGDVYFSTMNAGCLYLPLPDGSISTYNYDAKLVGDANHYTVKWDDDSDSTWLGTDYALKAGGCGIMNSCYMVENVDTGDLMEAGQTDNGTKIYLAKNTSRNEVAMDELPEDADDVANYDLNSTYQTYVNMFEYIPEETRPERPDTYEEFLAKKPIMYWQDPFGRFSGLIRSEYRPPAECGKPVIYLYPEKTTEVSVKVGIDKFTKTEPDYGENGWTVIADKAGNLLNLADGKTYPYLFWEGTSDKALQLSGGFVVAKADVDGFLRQSLVELGLNEQESADFRDFWVDKMQAVNEPYLLVSFVGTSDFNKIAPLDISPAPESLIRVFMYYQPLWQPIEIPAQKLSAPERVGFTVVEWGGTSSDGWQTR